MKNKKIILVSDIFPDHLFWEYKINMLDFKRDKNLIIARALYFSSIKTFSKDIKKIESIYTKKEIAQCIKTTKELISNEVCDLISKRYNTSVKQRFSYL